MIGLIMMNEISNKINELIKELTLEEKVGMIHGSGLFQTKGVERLNIKPLKMADGPMGVREDFLNDQWISLNQSDDYVTYLPSGSAIASSWNNKLAYEYGKVLGSEARGRGKDVILAPSINIVRSPLCGRNFEYLSEDPVLTSGLAVNMVKGIQEYDVVSCAKHFAVNNQETKRLEVDVIVQKKTLHEVYFKAFRDIVKKANAYGLMSAYNKINGEFASHNKWLLNDVLRDDWGYKHLVISDWGAVNDTVGAAESSLDIEMSVTNNFDDYYLANPLIEKVKKGEIKESLIDEKVEHILRTMFEIKMLGDTENRKNGSYNTKAHQRVAHEIALESIVLLKNDENVLPLDKNIKKLLVIGDNAIRHHSNKGGSAEIKALYEISPLMGIKTKLGGNVDIKFTPGYYVDEEDSGDKHWQEVSLEEKELQENKISEDIKIKQQQYLNEAIRLAKEYENIIIFAGLNHDYDLEGQDRLNIELPYKQDILINEVLKINPNTVVHILSGSAVDLSKFNKNVKALLWSSYIGMETGHALSNVIFGDKSPSAKLTETFAYKLNDYPSHSIGEFPGDDKVLYTEESSLGYRHFLKEKIKPLYPFGHGLSYSDFEYNNFKVEKEVVSLDIKNIGHFDANEIIQVYIKNKTKNETMVLAGYNKIFIEKNQEVSLLIELDLDVYNEYDEELNKFKLVNGTYEVFIGTSVLDIIYQTEIKF